jgi:hypothetical protein
VLAAVVMAGAGIGGASPTTDEPTTTAAEAAATTTTADAVATTTTGATTTTVATASSAEFTATLDAECEGDTGQPLLAAALRAAALPDGSLRVIELLQRCDVEFAGPVDAELGRPLTNVEALIADPVNNVTPNQAQLDQLNAELAIYWRIADAWVQAQAGGAAAETAPAVETSAPATETVPPGTVEATATTEG